MVSRRPYSPDHGDVIWITLDPQAGHEQAGRRPTLVLSPAGYNARVGLAIVCPVTSRVKDFPFEFRLPDGLPVGGVVLSDQTKSIDCRARWAECICRLPSGPLNGILRDFHVPLITTPTSRPWHRPRCSMLSE